MPGVKIGGWLIEKGKYFRTIHAIYCNYGNILYIFKYNLSNCTGESHCK